MGQQPGVHYDRDEKIKMQPYLTPSCVVDKPVAPETRQVDKTSLISWQSNKISAPMAYQSAKADVAANAGQLLITDLASEHLEQLLGQAEANESAYPHFAEGLVEHELQQRSGKQSPTSLVFYFIDDINVILDAENKLMPTPKRHP